MSRRRIADIEKLRQHRGGARKGAGRPKLAPEDKRSAAIMIRVTPSEKAALIAKHGIRPGAALRSVVLATVD